ncbi:trypsin-like serine protease [Streptomyces sp. ISL-98]|nr:trypsin-like serine protease [Streptomyces sp. ISL-98]
MLTTMRTVVTAAHCLTGPGDGVVPLEGVVFSVFRGVAGPAVASVEGYEPAVLSEPNRENFDDSADVGRLFLRTELPGGRPLRVMRSRLRTDVLEKEVRMYGTGLTPTGRARAVNRLEAHTYERSPRRRLTYQAVHDRPRLARACGGDSGGPVVLVERGEDVLAGIIVSGLRKDCVAQPTEGRTTVGVVSWGVYKAALVEQPRD